MTDRPHRSDRLTRISAVVQRRVPSVFRMDSIKSQIVVFAILAALIPSVTMAWISYAQNRNALTEKIREELRSTSRQTAREIDIWLKDREYDMRVFASSFVVRDALARWATDPADDPGLREALDAATNYLASIRERFTVYDELLVIAPNDSIIASGTGATPSVQLPEDWLEEVEPTRPVLGTPYWDLELGRPNLAMALAIESPDGAMLGAIAAVVNLRELQPTLAEFLRRERDEIYLTTEDARLVLAARLSSPELMARGLDSALAQVLAGGTPADGPQQLVHFRGVSGTEVVGAATQVPGLPWYSVAEMPVDEAYADIARLRNVTLMIVITLVLAIGLIAYRLGLLIVRPLDRLTTAAGAVAKGDLTISLPDAGAGEVGYLTDVFVYMVQRLREGREKLDEAHEELKKTNAELERLSITDALTGLYNRRYLMRTLEAEIRRAGRTKHPFAILMTDVDHFKSFNDTYGHQAGDEVLARVAGVLQDTVREVDCAARYGGEEFSVMLPETDLEGAAEVAERVRIGVAEEPFVFRGKAVRVTLSVGVAEYPTDGETSEAIIEAADRALYQAKRKGRNRVVKASRRARTKKKEA